jgi:phosphate transport system substrate-binding protein
MKINDPNSMISGISRLHSTLQRCVYTCAVFMVAFLPATVLSAELIVPGAGSPEAILRALATTFNQTQSTHRVTIPPSSRSVGALRAIRKKESPLARMGRPLKQNEIDEGLHCMPFASDAVVFITGAGVNVKNLSESQLAAIFSGKVSNWREVGGISEPIRVVVRQLEESSLELIKKALPLFRALEFSAMAKTAHTDNQTINLLDRFDYSIGWGTFTNLALASNTLNAVQLNGIVPSSTTVAGGQYPIKTTACLLYKHPIKDPAALAFVDFIFSSAGRDIIQKSGALAIKKS